MQIFPGSSWGAAEELRELLKKKKKYVKRGDWVGRGLGWGTVSGRWKLMA